ncbi:MAG: decaprenyl-phosphate phosphoribosyltransferase, partial [Acidimicrobiales bacterium]
MLMIMHLMQQLFIAIRPKQWMKNVLVLAAPLAAGTFFQLDIFQKSLGAFFIFCGVAACIYLVNDSFDRKMDAQHPMKSF